MSLIHNERTKLTANALDRASTACFAVGALGQAFNVIPVASAWLGFASVLVWTLAAYGLHLAARRVLGGLTP